MRWREDSAQGHGLRLHVRRVVDPPAPAVLLLHGLGVGGSIWQSFARRLLPHLAAVLEHTLFIGHDSGISHLAAAAGANCVLLFGPTDPAVWSPANENVRVLQAPKGEMSRLKFKTVCDALKL